MMKSLITLIIAALLTGCGVEKQEESQKKEIKPVKTSIIKRETMYKRIIDNSDIEPINEVDHITETGGEVQKINYRNGDRVEKGDLILILSNESISSRYFSAKADLENKKVQMDKAEKFSREEVLTRYQEAKSNYISAKGNLHAAEISFKEKQSTFAGNEQLYKEGLISEREYLEASSTFEQAKNIYNSLKNGGVQEKESTYLLYKKYIEDKSWKYNIANSKSEYELALAEFNAAKKDFEDLAVNSKISGAIADMNLDLYQYLDEKVFLLSVLDDSMMKVEMGVPGTDISDLFIGKEVKVYIPDVSQTVTGKIYEINPSADSTTKKFTVKISLDNNERLLKKGMYSEVNLETKPQEVLVVPKEAVMIKDLLSFIAIIENGNAKIINIKTGVESDSLQEIISSEITEGDKVVIQGQYLLENGDPVMEVE